MKVTIDLPDDLYRQVKSKAALEGRTVREVTTELYRYFLRDTHEVDATQSAGEWLDEWVALGDEALKNAPAEPTGTDVVSADRSRLDSQ